METKVEKAAVAREGKRNRGTFRWELVAEGSDALEKPEHTIAIKWPLVTKRTTLVSTELQNKHRLLQGVSCASASAMNFGEGNGRVVD